jgi:hypothetical protein
MCEQADESRPEADMVDEALALRWAQELGDAYRDLWDAGAGLTDSEAEEIVEADFYEPRRQQRRRPV